MELNVQHSSLLSWIAEVALSQRNVERNDDRAGMKGPKPAPFATIGSPIAKVRRMCAAFLAGCGSREGYSLSKALAIASSGIPISCVWLGKHIARFSLGRRQSRSNRSAEFGPSLVAVRAALSIACASVGPNCGSITGPIPSCSSPS
jgi:hypothetical protein